MRASPLVLLSVGLVAASPFAKRQSASSTGGSAAASRTVHPGQTSSDAYPPTGTQVNTALFPDESVVGFPGPTLTGIEPFAIQTAPAALFPQFEQQPTLYTPNVSGADSSFNAERYWGNLAPFYSVPSSAYGLSGISPNPPSSCEVVQLHGVYRHGARYPTSGSAPAAFAAFLNNATVNGTGFTASGDLAFLNSYQYPLGAELLTAFGRLQNYIGGATARVNYGKLLNNYTASGQLPVLRTESQDRMVKTALNWMAGFFGVPEYQTEASLEIMVEAAGVNNTFAPYYRCNNSNVARGSLGTAAAANFSAIYFNSTAARINKMIQGVTITPTQVVAMLQLCAYETDALGYSSFCSLFTEADFKGFEYYFDLSFYYNNGRGSTVGAAQGKAYLQEFLSRLTNQRLTAANGTSAVNATLDADPALFPFNQSLYIDFTHEVSLLDILTAFNFTALGDNLPVDGTIPSSQKFIASQVVPFATRLQVQILECSSSQPTRQARFLLNDATLPPTGLGDCKADPNGLCAVDTVIAGLQRRIDEIDFDYDCYGTYNASLSTVTGDGRALRS